LRAYRLSIENQRLVNDLSAKNQALLQLNHELEAKIAERTRELEEANARLSRLAVTDGLTGLFNHRHFQERLALEVERSVRNGLPLSLLMLDVDYFKKYNDAHGHPAGDELLNELAGLMREGRRANDVVARYGGEEFAIVLIDTPKLTAMQVAEKLRKRIDDHRFHGRRIGVSIGVAGFPDDADSTERLIQAADSALYQAKHQGRNRVCMYTEA
jgi:diguanylate cyclase (GGDEF)-like protein